jgi:phage-related tail fiber protein
MANTVIALRSSGVASNVPDVGSLANGEVAINFADGILYYKTDTGTLGTIQTAQPGGLDTEVQFNDGGSFGGDSGFTYNKSTDVITVAGGVVSGGINLTPTLASAFNHANAAFDAANTAGSTDFTTISATPGTYGNNVIVPVFVLAANGRISSVTNTNIRAASTTESGIVQLNDTITSTSTTEAGTANSVKNAYQTASDDAVAFSIALG